MSRAITKTSDEQDMDTPSVAGLPDLVDGNTICRRMLPGEPPHPESADRGEAVPTPRCETREQLGVLEKVNRQRVAYRPGGMEAELAQDALHDRRQIVVQASDRTGMTTGYETTSWDATGRTPVMRFLSEIYPSPENDQLYRPIDPTDPEIVALANGITRPRLRPDVERTVDELVFRASELRRQGKLRAYADANRILSKVCGWDAPPFARDDDQYNLAVSRFVKEVGL